MPIGYYSECWSFPIIKEKIGGFAVTAYNQGGISGMPLAEKLEESPDSKGRHAG